MTSLASCITSKPDIPEIIKGVIDWKKQNTGTLFTLDFISQAGTSDADWYAFAVARCGIDANYDSYLTSLKMNVQKRYCNNDKLGKNTVSEWHRIALTALALNGDPTDMGNGINLVCDGVYNRSRTVPLDAQGINGCIFALIVLDSLRYSVPDNASDTRESIINSILKNQLSCGAFSLNGTTPAVDMTAMALQSLSPYYNEENIKPVVDKALNWLSSEQNMDGTFNEYGNDSLESIVQVIIALCSLGIDPASDLRFIKNGQSLEDAFMKYRTENGGFVHSLDSIKENSMSGSQALCALAALYRFRNGYRSLYDMRPESGDELKISISSNN